MVCGWWLLERQWWHFEKRFQNWWSCSRRERARKGYIEARENKWSSILFMLSFASLARLFQARRSSWVDLILWLPNRKRSLFLTKIAFGTKKEWAKHTPTVTQFWFQANKVALQLVDFVCFVHKCFLICTSNQIGVFVFGLGCHASMLECCCRESREAKIVENMNSRSARCWTMSALSINLYLSILHIIVFDSNYVLGSATLAWWRDGAWEGRDLSYSVTSNKNESRLFESTQACPAHTSHPNIVTYVPFPFHFTFCSSLQATCTADWDKVVWKCLAWLSLNEHSTTVPI